MHSYVQLQTLDNAEMQPQRLCGGGGSGVFAVADRFAKDTGCVTQIFYEFSNVSTSYMDKAENANSEKGLIRKIQSK